MRARALAACSALALLAAIVHAEAKAQCPRAGDSPVREVHADDIPIAHTPPGGYGARFPEPVLAACTEPLAPGAPDLRGLWRTLRAEQAEAPGSRALSIVKFLLWRALGVSRERAPVPAGDRIYDYVERIEQCGNRIVDSGGGTIADARADSSEENAVHDVSAFDFSTPITAIASYEDGVFVLRPPRIPIAITRRLDAEGHLVWHRPDLGDRLVTLERIGGPCDSPPGTKWAR
jgi:hypothetical protein